jgi:hypothetical protein
MDPKEIGWEDMARTDQSDQAQERAKWRAFVGTVILVWS